MSLTRDDFDNPEVANAANPSAFGYHHGPFPGVNGQFLSKVNGGVCWFSFGNANGTMCGQVFADTSAMWRHMRGHQKHGLQWIEPSRQNVPLLERMAGQNALKRYVLSRTWRNARFLLVPGRGPINGLIDQYATACERIARFDDDFASKFGIRFHRDSISPYVESPRGRRNFGVQPPTAAPTTPSRAERRAHRANEGAPGSLLARLQGERAANEHDRAGTPEISYEEDDEDEEGEEGGEEEDEEDEEEEDEEDEEDEEEEDEEDEEEEDEEDEEEEDEEDEEDEE